MKGDKTNLGKGIFLIAEMYVMLLFALATVFLGLLDLLGLLWLSGL